MLQPAQPPSYGDGQCNGDLPNDSVYTRFLYTIRYLVANNFYVVLDNQLNTDPTCTNDAAVRPCPCTGCFGAQAPVKLMLDEQAGRSCYWHA